MIFYIMSNQNIISEEELQFIQQQQQLHGGVIMTELIYSGDQVQEYGVNEQT